MMRLAAPVLAATGALLLGGWRLSHRPDEAALDRVAEALGRIAPREVGVTPDGHGFLLSVSKSADLEAGIWPLRADVLGLSPFSAPEEFGADA